MIGAIAGLSALGSSLALAKAAIVRADDAHTEPLGGLRQASGSRRPQRIWSTPPTSDDPRQASDTADAPEDAAAGGVVDTVEISPQARAKAKADADNRFSIAAEKLSDENKQKLQELRKRDQEVRAHEAAHKAAGGQYAGSVSLSYQTGPDGQQYAVGGEVPIDLSPVADDPQATIAKMRQVRAAALAPTQPSAADRQVAAKATEIEQKARAELAAGNGTDDADREPSPDAAQPSASASAAMSLCDSSFTPRIDLYA